MSIREEIIVEISTEKGGFHAADFSYFMHLFRAIYVAALDEAPSELSLRLTEIDIVDIDRIIKRLEFNLKINIDPFDASYYATKRLYPSDDLDIIDIRRRNPVDITFLAVPLAISVVAVVAAGAWTISGSTLKLPDFRTSIKNICKKFKIPK